MSSSSSSSFRPLLGISLVALLLATAAVDECGAENILSRMLRNVPWPATLRSYIDDVDIDPLKEVADAMAVPADTSTLPPTVATNADDDASNHIEYRPKSKVAMPSAAAAATATSSSSAAKTQTTDKAKQTKTNAWNDDYAGGGGDTSGWNPFTWFAPKLRSIPYNPDTDLQTV